MTRHTSHRGTLTTVGLAAALLLAVLLTAFAVAAAAPADAGAAPGVVTLAGTAGTSGATDATGVAARFRFARGVAVDGDGNVYVADTNSSTIRKITPAGFVTTLAGSAGFIGHADGIGAAASFNYPEGVACDSAGNVYVADTQNNMIRMVTPGGVVTTISGQLGPGNFGGYVDGPVASAMFKHPRGVAVGADGAIYVGDSGNDAVRVISTLGEVSTLAGGLTVFKNPRGLDVDVNGIVYVADYNNHRIAKIDPVGNVSTLAGSGIAGSADGVGATAQFHNPTDITLDANDNLYVTDSVNNTIRKVTAPGVVTTLAGAAGIAGSNDGLLANARFNDPMGIGIDASGNLYIADRANCTIRKTVPEAFFITASGGARGTVSPSGVIGVESGGSITFTITPDAFYHVADVLVDGSSVGAVTSYSFTSVAADHTIAATFAQDFVTITPSAGPNGSISPNTPETFAAGGSRTYTIAADAGYHILDVTVDGSSVGRVASYTFTNVAADHSIHATFEADFVITPSAGANGSISPSTPQTVTYGGSQAFTITANAGYHVGDVLVDGGSVGAVTSYTFTNVISDHTIAATFEANPIITIVSPNSGSFTQGSNQTVTWTIPAPGVGTGYFHVWLKDTTTNVWTRVTASQVNAVAGQTTYTATWNVTQPAATYKLWVYFYAADGTALRSTVSSGVVTVASNITPALVAPNSGSFTQGAIPSVTWTMYAPGVSSGYFHVWLKDTTTNAWTRVTASQVNAVAGQTTYTVPWSVTQAAGDYTLWVWYYANGGTVLSKTVSSGTITILFNNKPTLVSPNSGSFTQGASPNVTWTMFTPGVSTGYFHVWLKDTTTNVWTRVTASQVNAVAGKITYTVPWSVTQPVGTYRLWVYYYDNAGNTLNNAVSSGTITILFSNKPTLVTPNSGGFTRGTNSSVTWTMYAPGVSTGYFHVWLKDTTTNVWTRVTASQFNAVAGKITYTVPWSVTQPVGTYRLWVYYYDNAGNVLNNTSSSGTVSITP